MNRLLFGATIAALLIVVSVQEGCNTAPQASVERPLKVPTNIQVEATMSSTPITINITQQEYETALAQWQSHHIQDYEITLVDSSQMIIGGKMRLRFELNGAEPQLIEYIALGQDQPRDVPLDTLSADDKDHLQGLSVEEMFNLIGGLFSGKNAIPSSPASDYDIAFDPILGYPTHIYSRAFSPQGAPVTECCLSYEVLAVDILRTSTPGMPRTGNSGP
jgi:hypothetical protein